MQERLAEGIINTTQELPLDPEPLSLSMAPRLSIVISQAPSHDAAIADIEQSIVTALMFEPGMDPMLIGHIESIQAGTTDHLCLEGIRGDFVLLAWLPIQSAYDHLARLGLYARPGILPPILKTDTQTANFPTPPQNSAHTEPVNENLANLNRMSLPVEEQLKRRLYFVDLRSQATRDPKNILQGLKDLLQDRQTKTVTLQLTPKASATSKPTSTTSNPAPPVSPIINISPSSPAITSLSKPNDATSIPSRAEAHSSVTPMAHDDDDPQWQQLDKLLDDFDSLEI